MSRIIPIILFITGIFIVCYYGYQLYESKVNQIGSLAEAKKVIQIQSKNAGSIPLSIKETKMIDGSIGILEIPKLEKQLPIVQGTDQIALSQGVGHYNGTALPGENNQILLSGHRGTVFHGLGELSIEDQLIVKMPYGEYEYFIKDTEIVDADDRTVIRDTAPNEVLTLSTCYPFDYIGDAPKRYIIYAIPK